MILYWYLNIFILFIIFIGNYNKNDKNINIKYKIKEVWYLK